MAYSTIVVGSGISGLSAAIVLAKHGRKPLVLEAHSIPGGCMQMFQRRSPDGPCRFDTGVHYVGSLDPGQIMWRLFRYLGVEIPTTPLDRECFDRISLPSGDFCMPVGWDNVAAALKQACPNEAAIINAYVARMRQCESSLSWHTLNPDAEGAYDRELFETSLQTYLQTLGVSPRLRSLICAQSSLYAVSAADTPLGIHAPVVGSAIEGPHYINGGGDAITRRLVGRLDDLGGTLRLRASVKQAMVEGDRVVGVELTDGETLHADEVILAVHPKVAVQLMPIDAYRGVLRTRMAEAKECVGAFVVYGTVDASADMTDVSGRNHYLLRDDDPDCFYEPQLENPSDAIVNFPPLNETGPQLFSAMGSARWDWFAPWTETRTLKRDADYKRFKGRIAGNILTMIEQRLPQLAGRLKVVETSTPLTLRDYAGYPQGGIYGNQPSLGAQGRNGVRRRTRYRGLYVTGAGTGTPGVLGACVTGFGVAGAILGTTDLINEVRSQTDDAVHKHS